MKREDDGQVAGFVAVAMMATMTLIMFAYLAGALLK